MYNPVYFVRDVFDEAHLLSAYGTQSERFQEEILQAARREFPRLALEAEQEHASRMETSPETAVLPQTNTVIPIVRSCTVVLDVPPALSYVLFIFEKTRF
jgi:hypothetical protein